MGHAGMTDELLKKVDALKEEMRGANVYFLFCWADATSGNMSLDAPREELALWAARVSHSVGSSFK